MEGLKTNEQNTERVSTYLTKETLTELKKEAKKRGLTVSSLIRLAILEILNKKKKG